MDPLILTGALLVDGTGAEPTRGRSVVVVDGRIALPEGDANRHRASGGLNIWRLPR